MPAIVVEPALYERVEEVASDQEASVGEVLAEAISVYLWQQDRRKISEESKVYRQRHAELKTRYLGEFIAMHKEGQGGR